MKKTIGLILGSALLLAGATHAEGTLVLQGATLVDSLSEAATPEGVVVIRDDRIQCAGTAAQCAIPENAHIMNLAGKFLTPGLVDAHVHYTQTAWYSGRPDALDLRDAFPYAAVEQRQRTRHDRYDRAFLCSGVTAVYDVGGFPWTWDLRAQNEHSPQAPHVAAAGPLLTHGAREILNLPFASKMVMLDNAENGRVAVRAIAEMKSDALKIWFLQPEAGQEADIDTRVQAAADEAHKLGLPVIVHATELRQAKVAVRAGARLLVHSVEDQAVDEELIALMKAHDTILTPTLTVVQGYINSAQAVLDGSGVAFDNHHDCAAADTVKDLGSAGQFRDHPSARQRLSQQRNDAGKARYTGEKQIMARNLKTLIDAGIVIAMGTDAGNPGTVHGPSVYAEMEAMQAAGMTPYQVLRSATLGGAMAMRRDQDFGSLSAGKIADLVITDKNPLDNIANMRSTTQVIRAGVVHDIESLRGI